MHSEARVIPVEGISSVPVAVEDIEAREIRQQKIELLLLNIASGLALLLVACAWVALALA